MSDIQASASDRIDLEQDYSDSFVDGDTFQAGDYSTGSTCTGCNGPSKGY